MTTTTSKKLDEMTRAEILDELRDRKAAGGHSKSNLTQLRKALTAARRSEQIAPIEETAPVDVEQERAAEDRIERTRLAKEEHRAVKAWEKAGRKGERPSTPNLDAMQEQYENGGAKATKSRKSAKADRPAVQFLHDGKPMVPNMNRLSCLAYNFTKGLDGDRPRISTDELRAILVAGGVDPDAPEWEFKLDNGIVLASKLVS